MSKQKGFVILDIIISLGILVSLLIVAVITFDSFGPENNVLKNIDMISKSKPAIIEYYYKNEKLPIDENALEIDLRKDEYVSINIKNGEIFAIFGNEAHSVLKGNYIKLTPVIINKNITWECSSDVKPKYLPKTCHDLITSEKI